MTISWFIAIFFICRIIYLPIEAFILISIVHAISTYVKRQLALDTSWIIPVFFPLSIIFYCITAWISFIVYTNPYLTVLPSSLFSIFITIVLIMNGIYLFFYILISSNQPFFL